MIDPMVSLSFSVYSNRGTYALLLGSGISRAAGIPTGWEVVQDLIRKVAKLEGNDCEPDPGEWFKKKHGGDPDYSKLLDAIAKTPSERQQLLRGYFEPNDDERKLGLKLPSVAHKAIARLVAAGYLRVIITTNFDRLTERALEDEGLMPTVISSVDQLSGALPLAHSGATIVKLHGDYLDTRIKNTEQELSAYDGNVDRLLDRIFDEYGLIVSGWSGDWDIALRSAIERCPTRRFTTYWTSRSSLSSKVKELVVHRQAVVLQIKDANYFFESLREKVLALEDMATPHPLSARMAVSTVKRYLVDSQAKIRLRDLVHEATEKLIVEISVPEFGGQSQHEPAVELTKRIEKYESLSEILLSVVIVGCYWGNKDATTLWVSSLQRIANPNASGGGLTYLIKLRRYPALLLLYGAGLAAIAASNYENLAAILAKPKVKDNQGVDAPFCTKVYANEVMENSTGQLLPGMANHNTAVSDHLFERLREPLRDYLPRDDDYEEAFDRFEYLLALVYADLVRYDVEGGWWGPVGCFAWRARQFGQENRISLKIETEIRSESIDWAPLKAGLFGGSVDQAKVAIAKLDIFLKQVRFF